MKLYLTRHGDAPAAPVDAERQLSHLGLQQAEALGRYLAERNVQPVVIYHSGLIRAQRTAAIIAEQLGQVTIEKIAGLRPNDSPEDILANIETWTQDTLLVSHLPFIAILLSLLTGENQVTAFYPTTTVCLIGEGRNWRIESIYKGLSS